VTNRAEEPSGPQHSPLDFCHTLTRPPMQQQREEGRQTREGVEILRF